MKLLVIGADGFVGHHILQKSIEYKDLTVSATYLIDKNWNIPNIKSFQLDVRNSAAMDHIIGDLRPDYIIHLAAQSSVSLSWSKPTLTFDINVNGTINLLESVRNHSKSSRVLLIGSGEEYGKSISDGHKIDESTPLKPVNIYALTKSVQSQLADIYIEAYGLDIIMTRSFNHFGPGQSPNFVIADFCKQVVEIEKQLRLPEILVGNLSAERDFTDVRDIVDAYFQLLFKGQSGETYNVGSGKSQTIQSILETIIKISDVNANVKVDILKFRPIDVQKIVSDITKISKQTGWYPRRHLEDSLNDTLNYWRQII